MRALGVATWAILAAGCGVAIKELDPKPNIDLAPSRQSLCVHLAPEIKDKFDLPPVWTGSDKTHVEGWRPSLVRGFKNGFAPYFPLVWGGHADLTLMISEAVPEVVASSQPSTTAPGNVYQSTSGGMGTVQIRYRARLVDRRGQVLQKSFGTVSAKRTMTNVIQGTTVAESAVETMYEAIARDCFGMASGPAPAAAK